jgi:hypothetical protein
LFAGELVELQTEFRRLVGMTTSTAPALTLRLAISEPASVRSRRSLDRICLL